MVFLRAGRPWHDWRMAVTGIDHVQLAMPPGQEERVRGFYEGLLGIAWVPKPEHLARRGGCWFGDGAVKVHLGVEQDFRPARKAHPALLVADLAGLAAKLTAAGLEIKRDEPLEGYDRIYVDDPFGNRIELMQPRSGSNEGAVTWS
jgi:catechol 2,3-dioxygenase-like lactoylglutathione lyase family enzyme